jgi:hypothetical protein
MLGVLAFYWVLRELKQSRSLAVALPLVFGMLPHYSTDRFWYAASQANLSMLLYFCSLWCDLRTLETSRGVFWRWRALGFIALVASCLAYEVFMPLFLLNPLIVAYRVRQTHSLRELGRSLNRGGGATLVGGNLLGLLLVASFKKLVSQRADALGFPGVVWFVKQSIQGALILTYGDYGVGLPETLWRIGRSRPAPMVLCLSGVVTLLVVWYLRRTSLISDVTCLSGSKMCMLVGGGLSVSGLAYGYLYGINFRGTTGINNRVVIGAALGVACSLVGWMGWCSSFVRNVQARARMFCILIGIACGLGCLINNFISTFWVAAFCQQRNILEDIRQNVPALPARATLLLDGFCSYVGPGIVFETFWDVSGALQILYKDRNLHGDVLKPTARITNDGIVTFIYAEKLHYSYSDLWVYNVRLETAHQLIDADTAERYFASAKKDCELRCPQGAEGYGAEVF